jgi:hypothetical protein
VTTVWFHPCEYTLSRHVPLEGKVGVLCTRGAGRMPPVRIHPESSCTPRGRWGSCVHVELGVCRPCEYTLSRHVPLEGKVGVLCTRGGGRICVSTARHHQSCYTLSCKHTLHPSDQTPGCVCGQRARRAPTHPRRPPASGARVAFRTCYTPYAKGEGGDTR